MHQGSGDSSDEPGQRNNIPQKRIPRPPNAFILYRREKQPAIIAANRHLSNAEVSRRISEMWRSEPEETRREWERYADRKKLEHMQTYPNYVYRPNKNKSK
ncbi:high mobility group box domain-containing protein, partial [Gigaspora rosea]